MTEMTESAGASTMTSKNAAGLDLHIPQVAIDTLNICGVDAHLHDRDDACVKAISAPVVAAELRRIANVLDSEANAPDGQEESDQPFNQGLGTAVMILRGRADELDPGSPATTRED